MLACKESHVDDLYGAMYWLSFLACLYLGCLDVSLSLHYKLKDKTTPAGLGLHKQLCVYKL